MIKKVNYLMIVILSYMLKRQSLSFQTWMLD